MKKNLVITLLCLLWGCGGGANGGKKVITWWHFWTDTSIKPVIEQIAADFEKQYPDTDVRLVDLTWADGHDKITIAFSSGTGPDVVELGSDWVNEFVSTGHLQDITQEVTPAKSDYLMWDAAENNGKIYGFPWILGTRVLYANLTLLVAAGYPEDFVPQNWAELLEAAQKINALGDESYGFGSNASEQHRLYKKFLPFLWANGGAILSGDGKTCLLDSDAAIRALEYYLQLCATGLTDTQRRLEDAFLEGRIGFVISGDWLLKRINNEKIDIHYMTGLIPGPEGLESSVSFAGGEYLCINSKTPNPKMAFELVKFICSPENQLKFCRTNFTANPSSKMAATDEFFQSNAYFKTFIEQMEKARMTPVHPKWVYIEAEFEKAIEAALYKTKTPQQALVDAKSKIERIIAE